MADLSTITLAAFLIAGTIAGARAAPIDGSRIVIIDGDTVALPCPPETAGRPGCSERVRLLDIDAPEISRPRCEAERITGLAARATLADLIRGRSVEVDRHGRDRFGRTLARLSVDDRDVGAAVMAAGFAVPWRPGRAAWADRCRRWCPGAPRCEE